MSPDLPHPIPEPGLYTPEEVELMEATRKLRARSEWLIRRSQAAARPPGARHRFPEPVEHTASAEPEGADDRGQPSEH